MAAVRGFRGEEIAARTWTRVRTPVRQGEPYAWRRYKSALFVAERLQGNTEYPLAGLQGIQEAVSPGQSRGP